MLSPFDLSVCVFTYMNVHDKINVYGMSTGHGIGYPVDRISRAMKMPSLDSPLLKLKQLKLILIGDL